MKIVVNFDICDAHGECVIEAPDLFDLGDEDDHVTVLNDTPEGEQQKAANRAMESCPVAAITLED